MERFPRNRPVREIRTPVNGRNEPPRDHGEGVARHSLTHLFLRCRIRGSFRGTAGN